MFVTDSCCTLSLYLIQFKWCVAFSQGIVIDICVTIFQNPLMLIVFSCFCEVQLLSGFEQVRLNDDSSWYSKFLICAHDRVR